MQKIQTDCTACGGDRSEAGVRGCLFWLLTIASVVAAPFTMGISLIGIPIGWIIAAWVAHANFASGCQPCGGKGYIETIIR